VNTSVAPANTSQVVREWWNSEQCKNGEFIPENIVAMDCKVVSLKTKTKEFDHNMKQAGQFRVNCLRGKITQRY
jgi:hypothetical protein